MAFLFKTKKNQERALASRDGLPGSGSSIQSAASRVARDEKGSLQRSTPTGSLNSLDNDGSMGSPDQPYARQRGQSVDQHAQPSPQQQQQPPPQQLQQQQQVSSPPSQQPSDLPFRNGNAAPPMASNPNASLYPWSQRRLTYTTSHPSPFPRYGAAVNSVSSKEGDIYVMGGLINSSTVKGDLWMIEAGGNMACYPLATTAEGPGPRVGHSSLLVGNAFIVYGGDTKVEETDVLDETLYLLNTSTRQWSRALPAGPRPSGRYGHSLNILGSKIYIFGGQVEGYFMNDLAAYDLNQLQMPNNRWEMLQGTTEGNPVTQQGRPTVPPARTNHSMITFNDKMYLFGGTNGYQWFNDVWCYDPASNQWSQLDCIGYIPVPREGHAASLVDDVMYIFGGRTEEGADLGDLAAFRITSRRWYTFQNMGTSPSPRSGHSMTTVGKSVVVVGGEPSSATTAVNDLGMVYVLDTTKIRYPNDAQAGAVQKNPTAARRPSTSDVQNAPRGAVPRDATTGPVDAKRHAGPSREPGSINATNGPPNGGPNSGPRQAPKGMIPMAPSGPPPQGQPPQPAADPVRLRNQSLERNELQDAPASQNQSPVLQQGPSSEISAVNGRRTPTQQASKPGPKPNDLAITDPKLKQLRQTRGPGSVDSSTEPGLKQLANRPASPPPPARQTSNSNPVSRRSSGRNSQTVALLKELDSNRNRIAWYASELELARKAGYTPNTSMSPVLDSRSTETFDDEDKPLIEALLAMRQELANVQASVDKQAVLAARQVAEAEKQRDAAIQEAVYAKAKLAARTGGSISTPSLDGDRDIDDRVRETNRKLVTALSSQKELQNHVERLSAELEAERRARKLADDTATAAQKRMVDLEAYKQQTSLEVERLRSELHIAQKEAREQGVIAAEATAASELLRVQKSDFETKYNDALGSTKEHSSTLESLRSALAASAQTKSVLERQLEEERAQREAIEVKLASLKAEHEARIAELDAATQRLRDAEELAERHANEAKIHQEAILAGLDKISARDAPSGGKGDSDRIIALQGQLNAANALVRKYQAEADNAADKLRSAEERIAGLEAYQEQASREGVSIRRQLQSALRDTQSLQAANSELRQQLESQLLEANAITVQHNTLKDILSERGISPTAAARTRGLNSPREGSPEVAVARVRELEQQLSTALAAREEAKISAEEAEVAYREKLSQLDNDYQSAVHYVKGTEKMLKQMKEQLARYKADNGRLRDQVVELEDKVKAGSEAVANVPAGWENERAALQQKIDDLQQEMKASAAMLEQQLLSLRQELNSAHQARETLSHEAEETSHRLESTQKELEQLQRENAVLETRATEAEQKVGTLLDQVELSVDNYRRRSRQVPSLGSDSGAPATGGANGNGNGNGNGHGLGHTRQESSEAGSIYGGMSEARNSVALDNLANELDMLRSHWEATNKNYRISNAFEFETNGSAAPSAAKKDDRISLGLSESLADWRKRLDETHPEGGGTAH